jgi:hypothetical protein
MSDNGRQWAFALFRRFVHKQYLIAIHCKVIPGFQIIQLFAWLFVVGDIVVDTPQPPGY